MIIDIITELLKTVIIDNPMIFLDLWTIVHFVIGFILWKKFKLNFKTVLLILVAWEIIELTLAPTNPYWFETNIDIIWDMIIGMFGYYIAKKKFKW